MAAPATNAIPVANNGFNAIQLPIAAIAEPILVTILGIVEVKKLPILILIIKNASDIVSAYLNDLNAVVNNATLPATAAI